MSSLVKLNILHNIRTAAAAPAVPPSSTSYKKGLFGIRAYLFSSSPLSKNHPKDPNLVDDIKEGEGVFRFDASDGEPEMTPMTPNRKGSTVNKEHRWNAATDGLNKDTRSSTMGDMAKADGLNKDTSSSTMGDMAKAGTVKAMETGINMGDMAKLTMDNVWDAAKETADKIKEAVAGDEEEERKGYDIPASDGRVDDLRKKAGGYDLRNSHH